MYSINTNDVLKGLVVAGLTGSFLAVLGTVGAQNFDVFSADWVAIGKLAVNGAFGALIGYLVKNFFTDSNGKLMGLW